MKFIKKTFTDVKFPKVNAIIWKDKTLIYKKENSIYTKNKQYETNI